MLNEGDISNILDALADLKAKLQHRQEVKNQLTYADHVVLEAISRLRGIAKPKIIEEHCELEALLQATHFVLDELSRKDLDHEA